MTPEGKQGVLFIVGTPIGNLADLTFRALETLKAADIIACEDTRQSVKLLRHYEIAHKPLVSLHQHNEAGRSAQLVGRLLGGESVALVTDAGMPMVSDPGQRFLHLCLEAGIRFEVIPGPSAVTTAVTGSGFPADSFYFGGFLPNKKGQRERFLRAALEAAHTSVFFESPHRLAATLDQIAEMEPERLVCVGRELTKMFEEFRRGPAAGVAAHFRATPPKGEITLVVSGSRLPAFMRRAAKDSSAAGDPDFR